MKARMELREWLVEHQQFCPACGDRVTVHDTLHHMFVRRIKRYEDLLFDRINISLVCPGCHTPEAPDLNCLCALQKWTMGFTPQDVREWIDNLPFKVKPGLPKFFIKAEADYECKYNKRNSDETIRRDSG